MSLTSWGQLILVTHPRTGWKTAGDLVEAARRAPGKLNYASPGVGTPHHLSMELFKNTAKVFVTHIPYRGTGPAVTDLIGGQVDAMFLPIHVALQQVRAGRLVALAIGSDKRHPLLADLPTLAEARAGSTARSTTSCAATTCAGPSRPRAWIRPPTRPTGSRGWWRGTPTAGPR